MVWVGGFWGAWTRHGAIRPGVFVDTVPCKTVKQDSGERAIPLPPVHSNSPSSAEPEIRRHQALEAGELDVLSSKETKTVQFQIDLLGISIE